MQLFGQEADVRGFVPTPPEIVDQMVDRLFRTRPPTQSNSLLDPGCGTGAFLAGVLRWCAKKGVAPPKMVGIESEPGRARYARAAFAGIKSVQIRDADFLLDPVETFDFIVGNPPYVSIYSLSESEKQQFRAAYMTAHGRYDLYMLFFERALKSLTPDGILTFITPEKFLYVSSASPLRRILGSLQVEEIELVAETAFEGLVTYPTITTVVNRKRSKPSLVRTRGGTTQYCLLSNDGNSWMPIISGAREDCTDGLSLQDICIRVSCGVATGADEVFVRETALLNDELRKFALPTMSGRELTSVTDNGPSASTYSMLLPYSLHGSLLPERRLGALGGYLRRSHIRKRLEGRTCARRKPWYAFHETPPLPDILRPKILCKDITQKPKFWIDQAGTLVPRHSVYYVVPKVPDDIGRLCGYLNSPVAAQWLNEHCQRAANGFLRLQSSALKALPLPGDLLRLHPRRTGLQIRLELQGRAESITHR